LQLHPVTDRPMHVDFLRFNENTKIVIEIPVSFINEAASPGLKTGGVLNIVRRELELRCSPVNIPQQIEIDLTGVEIGESIHIASLNLPLGAEPITDRDYTIATLAAPTVMTAADKAEEAALEAGSDAAAVEGEAVGENSEE
jgi:large subunit ribosomal protein L25